MELASPITLTLPTRWYLPEKGMTRASAIVQLRELGEQFVKGSQALGGLYLRITDHVRHHELDPEEVRPVLRQAGFPVARISEVLRVAGAPEPIYAEYSTSRIGFRVALAKTRLYHLAQGTRLPYKRRQARRMSARLIRQVMAIGVEAWRDRLKGWRLQVVSEVKITNIVRTTFSHGSARRLFVHRASRGGPTQHRDLLGAGQFRRGHVINLAACRT